MAYITQSDLEAFEKKVTKSGDTSPTDYCSAAMEMVANYLGYDPESKIYETVIRGDGGVLAELEAFPITAISEFKINGEDHNPQDIEFAKRNYVCMADDSVFQRGAKYYFKYTAGNAQVPKIIKQVALQIAALLWESAGGNLAVSSTSFADTGTRVFNNFQADRFLTQIQNYRKVLG